MNKKKGLKKLFYHNLLPVALSGVIDRAIFHPWETIITIQQDCGKNFLSVYRNLKNSGWRAFYPGYIASVLAAIPIRISIFSTYFFVREYKDSTKFPPLVVMTLGSILSGIIEAIILCPSESYRIRKSLSATANLKFNYTLLFKGLGSLVARTTTENTICLVGSDMAFNFMPQSLKEKKISHYISGFAAGYISQFFSTPFDVIKTRRIKEPDVPFKKAIKSLFFEGAFFRSALTKASRAGVCNAMMIGTSHLIKSFITKDIEEDSIKKSNWL